MINLLPLLRGLPQAGWTTTTLLAGARLFRQGDPVDAVHIVESGSVRLLQDSVPIGTLGPGGSLGESSVFFAGETRSADAVALSDCVLRSLTRAEARQLRARDPATYDALLAAAVEVLWERLHRTDAEILTLAAGGPLAAPAGPGTFAKLYRRFRETVLTPPDVHGSLRGIPVLGWAPEPIVGPLATALSPTWVGEGEALFVQGDDDPTLLLVATGAIAIVRQGETGGAREIARMTPGALFGLGGFVAAGPRTASAVAVEASWVFRLTRPHADALPGESRRALLEALLAITRSQLDAATRSMIALRRSEATFESMIRATARLQGWQAGDPNTAVRLEDLVAPEPLPAAAPQEAALFGLIRGSIIGGDEAMPTPFGLRRIVYADYTASGRSLSFIEDFLRDQVMSLYANTHTEASASGLQTTRYREEARALVARSVGAGVADEVVFVGSGATAAINRMVDLLALRRPLDGSDTPTPGAERPVVFIGLYEHHSNILPWRHSRAEVVTIFVDADGRLDLADLERKLVQYARRPLKIGSFSAGSNVTGASTDTVAVATLLHRHGALSFWDYAAAGPYAAIHMNPAGEGIDSALAYKDAIFLSPHKFIGGPGTPGVLVLKKALARFSVPTQPGGGTVDFVTRFDTLYSDSIAHREEAGTPAILESIRCGLVFQLKDRVGVRTIHRREQELVRTAIDAWTRNPAVRVLGPLDDERLSIVAFMIRHRRGFLHHNFVVALLNDLFGIQSRGGCSCAGPYGAYLLTMNDDLGRAYLDLAQRGYLSLKPGWARVSFNYFISDAEFRFIVQAINLVGAYGHALLPQYTFDEHGGLWTHRDAPPVQPRRLADLDVSGGTASWPSSRRSLPESALDACLDEGRRVLLDALEAVPPPVETATFESDFERYRWFPVPHEAAAWLRRAGST